MLQWTWEEKNGIKFITIPSWLEQGVDIAFSSRLGGVSADPFASLNLGLHVGDIQEKVLENRRRIMSVFNQDINRMVCCRQIHGSQVAIISSQNRGCGSIALEDSLDGIDGMVTDLKGLYMATFYADCIPVFIFDPVKKCIGMAHSGWKGTMSRIAVKTVKILEQEFGCSPKNMEAFIGPGIGPCCFEIQAELAANATAEFSEFRDIIIKEKNGRYTWDLQRTIQQMLAASGLNPDNIIRASLCTSCHNDLFYSYRKEKGITGRMGAILGLRN